MYGMYAYINWSGFGNNVGIYSSPMECMGNLSTRFFKVSELDPLVGSVTNRPGNGHWMGLQKGH